MLTGCESAFELARGRSSLPRKSFDASPARFGLNASGLLRGKSEGRARRTSFVQVGMGNCSGAAMTPMRAKADDKIANHQGETRSGRLNLVSGTAAQSRSGEHSVFKAPAEGILSAAAAMRLDSRAIEGTVGAAVAPLDEDSYSSGSAALLSGELLG